MSSNKDDPYSNLEMMASLIGENCHLEHGGYFPDDTSAVDLIVIPIGDDKLTVPVCRECAETLYDNDTTWVLFLCVRCSGSQWKIRRLINTSDIPEGEMIVLLQECPLCR